MGDIELLSAAISLCPLDAHHIDSFGYSHLHRAVVVLLAELAAVKILLTAGADPNRVANNRCTVFDFD
jgi:hypothetical protein